MSEELLVRHCSPTLAGIKTGNLFSCPCSSRSEIMEDVRRLNRRLAKKGLCIMPLRVSNGRALLYLFRPDRLRRDLTDADALRILREAGYENVSRCACLTTLMRRLGESADFPHEIGLFLSYPPEDVRGFIENHARNYKCSGVWKVYGDADAARRKFDLYARCTTTYCRLFKKGCSLDSLAVPEK